MGARALRWRPIVALLALVFVWSCGNDDPSLDPGTSSLGVGSLTGVVRGAGALLENARVETLPATIIGETDAVGRYTLNGLAPGSYTIVVSATGFTTETKPASIIAGRTMSLDFDVIPSTALGRLQGTVTDGDVPLENVTIATVPPTFSVITVGDGRYDFLNVTPGIYRVDASRPGFWPATMYVEAVPGVTTVGNIGLGRRNDAVIAGYVRDVAGNPVANATVSIFWDSQAETKTTGSDGAFRFTRTDTRDGNLPTGFYVVTAAATNYFAGSRSFEAFGGIERDGTVILNLTSTVPPVPGAIAGRVWTEAFVPISGATVVLDATSPTPSTTTTVADGRFYFTAVTVGTHTLSVSHPDYVPAARPVDVGTNVTADGLFTLKRVP